MNFINLTPHPITILKDGESITIDPCGTVARVKMEEIEGDSIMGIPTITRRACGVEGLPEPEKDTIYIVSAMVLDHIQGNDVVAPDTGPTAVRDDKGRIQAVTRLVRP